ncbi:lytic transglycosylase domain-containing protein [Sphingomonas sp.]|uniref:lytic transglycosylase domain-containing protein n=1 Tax=Sphingomonas sp. TaxID=28214 RepID=UPI0017C33BA8|nr:lytic transglycosylase domain-containing protein [Sphingomonas sp.]MBA3510689.1 lytic transglycosylase domain-containing protein [Sphingomonas sp.]
MKPGLFALAALLCASPAWGQDPLAPVPETPPPSAPAPAPTVSPPPQAVAPPAIVAPALPPIQVPLDWRGVFAAIRGGNWRAAEAGIALLPSHVLSPVARAQLYTAKGSPTVDLGRLQALLAEAPDLPQAEQLARMALSRGATNSPMVIPKRPLAWLGSAPRRSRARPVQGEPAADQLRTALEPLLKVNSAPEAEALLLQTAPLLSVQARAEAGQRIAWAYYQLGRDVDARRVADSWRHGASGDWAAHSAWVSGLASWRLNDCEAASRAFREVAGTSRERELGAGGYYWAARSEQACRRPPSVAPLLKAAARSTESFYGLIAREALGLDTRLPPNPRSHSAVVETLPNVRRALELVAIGERWLAEDLLRHQARIGRPAEHHGLIEFAKRLDLAGAQFWLAHNGQPGAVSDPRDRYPVPRWAPITGWRVDPALAFAHVIQESTFRADAVSPADAVGLMQVRPGTAQDMARARNLPYSRASLTDPGFNLEFGQSFIEQMRRSSATGGQLPRIMAAYNAGPTPVARWAWIPDRGDPLLWIESIPYWETRFYVPAVFRNMWVYQGIAGADAPTLKSMVEHSWPAFPTGRTDFTQSVGGN